MRFVSDQSWRERWENGRLKDVACHEVGRRWRQSQESGAQRQLTVEEEGKLITVP